MICGVKTNRRYRVKKENRSIEKIDHISEQDYKHKETESKHDW